VWSSPHPNNVEEDCTGCNFNCFKSLLSSISFFFLPLHQLYEDLSVWNVDYCAVFPALTLQNLRKLEEVFLNALEFRVEVAGSEYYHFNVSIIPL
jgi:hypothetical protein